MASIEGATATSEGGGNITDAIRSPGSSAAASSYPGERRVAAGLGREIMPTGALTEQGDHRGDPPLR